MQYLSTDPNAGKPISQGSAGYLSTDPNAGEKWTPPEQPKPQGAVSQGLERAVGYVNPANLLGVVNKGLIDPAIRTGNPFQGIGEYINDRGEHAAAGIHALAGGIAPQEGRIVKALDEFGNAVPGLESVKGIFEDIASAPTRAEMWARAAGHAFGAWMTGKAPEAIAAVAENVPKVTRAAGKGVVAAAEKVPFVGPPVKAGMKAFKEQIKREYPGLSGAAVDVKMARMPPQEIAATALRAKKGMEVAEIPLPENARPSVPTSSGMLPVEMTPEGPVRPSQTSGLPAGQASVPAPPSIPGPSMSGSMPSSTPIDPSRLMTAPAPRVPAPSGPRGMSGSGMIPAQVAPVQMGVGVPADIRPIPPNKMPVRAPDPVVPELAGQGKLSGAGANARQWIQDYAAVGETARLKAKAEGLKGEALADALAAARGEFVKKTLSGKMNYEDMRQLAAYTDDITTVNPGAPPAAVESHFRPAKLEGIERAVPESAESLADTYRAKVSDAPKIPEEATKIAGEVERRILAMKTAGLSRGQIKAAVLENILPRSAGYKPADIQRLVDMVLKESK